jgi:multiple sugar transport system substrate-binding protein
MNVRLVTVIIGVAALVAGCGGGGGGASASDAAAARGPIKVWYSNNQEEVAWAKQMVTDWNQAHPNEKITGQEIPTGKSSEEVIGAAITAGNAPCLVLNTSPAAVPGFQKQGGLVALDELPGGREYVETRSGAESAKQYESPDGKYYQLPWKANPVMIFYNKKLFKKAGIDADKPPLATYDEFLDTARKIVKSGAAPAAIHPAPTSEFYQSWFDFYPLFIAESGKQLVEDGKAQFNSPAGQAVAAFWKTMYSEGLTPNEKYNGDSFADGEAAMAIVGPWAVAVYGDKVDWGVAPVPTSAGKPAAEVSTFSDEKSIAMYSACKNRGTAWDVLKFATSEEQDGAFLDASGQMPMRTDLPAAYPEYFEEHPEYKTFADQASRIVEVPNVANSVTIWQTFRDAYSKSVIFGKGDAQAGFNDAATKIEGLAKEGS